MARHEHPSEHDLCDACCLAILKRLAINVADGHFTVMRFTTNWRVALTTPNLDTGEGREEIKWWATGETLSEAVLRLLDSHAYVNKKHPRPNSTL